MQVVHTRAEVEAVRRGVARDRVALIPTMGALHDGHLSHVAVARSRVGDREAGGQVWVSIFVNPTQFGPGEDFGRYPRTLELDLAACAAAGVDGVWVPGVEDVYVPGEVETRVEVLGLADVLEGAARPGHFAGVCRVVAKLLGVVRPGVMTLGEKDYQQLCVLRAMVSDLALGVEVAAVPTAREADGLARSSRNAYLDAGMRAKGLGLPRALDAGEVVLRAGASAGEAERVMRVELSEAGVELEGGGYAAVREAETMGAVDGSPCGPVVLLVAGRVSGEGAEAVRLIDNRVVALGRG